MKIGSGVWARRTSIAFLIGVAFAMSCGGQATEPHDGGVVEWRDVTVPEAALSGPDGTAADARHADGAPARDSEGRPPQLPSDAGTDQAATVVSVLLIPSASTVQSGQTVTFNVRVVYDDATTRDAEGSTTLTSSDERIVMLAGNQGVAFAVGVATITATVDGIVASTTITVTDSEVVAIAVSTDRAALWAANPGSAPASALSLASRTSANFYARALMSDGSDRDVTYAALWASSTANVVMQPGGRAYGWSAGKAVVSATLGGARGEVEVDVEGAQVVDYVIAGESILLPGTASTFALRALYNDGVLSDPINAAWQSSDTAVLSIGPAKENVAHVSASMLGSAVLAASSASGSASASMNVVVSNATLQSVQLIPARLELALPGTGKITVMGTYTDGTIVDMTYQAGWVVDPLLFVQDGIVGAYAAGTARVTAQVGSAPASEAAIVTVRAGTPTAIVLNNDVSIPQGFSIACSALASYGADDRFEIGGDVSWQTGDAAIASAAGSRLLGGSIGRTVYFASAGSVRSNERAVTVTAAKLLSIELELTYRVIVNQQTQLRVLGLFDDGSVLQITPHATFSTADEQIASVSNAPASEGVLRGTGVGTTSVTAAINGFTATITATTLER